MYAVTVWLCHSAFPILCVLQESLKVEMALTEAKFESAQRSLEADLQAQMEKKVSGCWWGLWEVGGGGFCDVFYVCLSISALPWQKIACPKIIAGFAPSDG